MIAITPASHAFELDGLGLKHLFGHHHKPFDAKADIPEDEEITIGNGIADRIMGTWPLERNPGLQQYINQVGYWIAMQSDRPTLPWRFGVINSNTINAYACPGGTILVTKGLYRKLRNESELAGVLGREIAHVLRKHQLKAIQLSLGDDWKKEIEEAAEDTAKDDKPGDVSDTPAAAKGYDAGIQLFTQGLAPEAEFEADRMGVVLAARAGYNPFGLVGVLQTLNEVSPAETASALMWKTLPSPASRLQQLETAMDGKLDKYQSQVTDTPRFDTTIFRK